MSLVELREVKGEGGAVSGGAMDRVVVRKRIDKRILIGGGAGAILLLILLFWLFAPRSDSQTVNPNRLTIAQVQQGIFEDFLPLTSAGRAARSPSIWTRSKAAGSSSWRSRTARQRDQGPAARGAFQRRPAIVDPGPPDRGRAAAQQHAQPGTGAAADPQRQRARPEPGADRPGQGAAAIRPAAAAGRKGLRRRQGVQRHARTISNYQRKRLAILKRSIAEDEALQASQLGQLRASTSSLNSSLSIARGSLSQLNSARPVSGQLSGFSIQLGQSLQQGERLGQIDSAGRNKLEADVDEFYLGRVVVGQTATIEVDGKTYAPQGRENLSAGPQRPVPDRPGVRRPRAAIDPARPDHVRPS